ncbi:MULTISPECIES: hypothetical protein [Helicobacter]|uniref:Uncharacterized protein n=1 Tax=Helicobacter typhlonius TaxID=76936 RepID=A0A0S4PRV5_9HELI|nr:MULTISPECIES: hypothetical protein [Helicobacter]CUU38949.1 Hypothetical protein BN2458_PEG0062 [Helicobacter typhlonius]
MRDYNVFLVVFSLDYHILGEKVENNASYLEKIQKTYQSLESLHYFSAPCIAKSS